MSYWATIVCRATVQCIVIGRGELLVLQIKEESSVSR
jgi:hypothetical protein